MIQTTIFYIIINQIPSVLANPSTLKHQKSNNHPLEIIHHSNSNCAFYHSLMLSSAPFLLHLIQNDKVLYFPSYN